MFFCDWHHPQILPYDAFADEFGDGDNSNEFTSYF